MAFTDTEIQAAVDALLFKEVEVPELKTGARDVLTLRDRVFDLLTTALLLRPDSYFYVILLAKNRLQSLVQQQITAIDAITEAGPGTTRASSRVKSTTDLVNAQAALFDLTAGLNSRSTGVRGSIGPAVDRFRRSISSFVGSELTKNVVVAGEVTKTGPELQAGIATEWSDAIDRHVDIVDAASNVANALSLLSGVRLPETSIRDIVSRIQDQLGAVRTDMESPTAVRDSRDAMLNLLTMRTVLTKASEFRNPELVLMPQLGDTSSVVFLDSDGDEAAIQGDISAPFNYDPGTTLLLEVNGAPVSAPLPGTSRAELRSKVFSPWVAPTPGDEAAFTVDFLTLSTFVIGGAYANGSLAAAALDAGLGPSIEVTWDGAANQIVFQSANPDDDSSLQLLIDTSDRLAFRDWAFPVAEVDSTEARGAGAQISDVVRSFGETTTTLRAESVEEHIVAFTGEFTAESLEKDILWDRLDSGTDLVADGTAVVISPSKNFDLLGVRPGMALHSGSTDYTITAVDGPQLTLSATVTAGALTYYLGPDYRDVPDGARVRVVSGVDRNNTGLYRVSTGGGQVARLVVDRGLPGLADPETVVAVFTQLMKLTARGTTTSSGIGALTASDGATALGLTITVDPFTPELTLLQLQGPGDFLRRGVKAGDIVHLTSPSGALATGTIAAVTTTTIQLVEGVAPFESGAWTYQILSSRADAYTALQAGATEFLNTITTAEFTRISTLVGRLIRGARYTGEIVTALTAYRSALSDLRTVTSSYVVPVEVMIDNVVRMMREQGFDRALDLFLSLSVDELFSMDPDGVSYSSWLIRKSATVAREVVPVSKYARSDRVVQEWRTVSFQPDAFDPRGEDTQR